MKLLLTKILETRSTDQRHETGRLKHRRTRTEENVVTVNEMVGLLNHKGQKQTHCSTRQTSKEKDLTKYSIVQIIHCIVGRKCILFTNTLVAYYCSFSCIYISQGSVATQLTRSGIFSNRLIANCLQNPSVKEFWKSINIWQRYRQSHRPSATFLRHSVYQNIFGETHS